MSFCLKVKKVIRHCDSIATLVFEKRILSYPGQFVMLNVFDYEEIPLSLSSPNSVTVKAVGETTKALVNFEGGEIVGIRGPFGRPFSYSNRALIVAGGIGVAPLRYLYHWLKERNAEVTVFYGTRSKEELVFLDEFEDVHVSTDDGSYGFKGNVVRLLMKENVNFDDFERVYCCGPPIMLKNLYDLLKEKKMLKKAEFSVERYMRCGIGLCGSCVLENGLRVCREGPVFRGDELTLQFVL
ncbi:dihydroorotate dehydrogenase electron transfer subunit [Archaeoglobus sp.]